MKLLCIVLLTSILISCSNDVGAQESDWASDPSPKNVRVRAGLAQPQDRNNPEPWLEVSWDRPHSFAGPDYWKLTPGPAYPTVAYIGAEIYKTGGPYIYNSRSSEKRPGLVYMDNGGVHDQDLIRAGCSVSASHITITADCADRYRVKTPYHTFTFIPDALMAGVSYEVRVLFVVEGIDHYSGVYRVTIPQVSVPTSTPQYTPTPYPTPIPYPTATPYYGNDTERLQQRIRELESELDQLRTEFDQLLGWGWWMHDWKATVDDRLTALEAGR